LPDWCATGSGYDRDMSKADSARSAAAIELADALLVEFNDPRSALKGIGREMMQKLLAYAKIAERPPRKKRDHAPAEAVLEAEPES
jgi:hypothetical protein